MDEPDFPQLKMNDPKAKLDGPKVKFNDQYSEMGGQQIEVKLIKTKLNGHILYLATATADAAPTKNLGDCRAGCCIYVTAFPSIFARPLYHHADAYLLLLYA